MAQNHPTVHTDHNRKGEPARLMRGGSTAYPANLAHRLAKLHRTGLLHGARWLDCGCADGGYTRAIAANGVDQVVGTDIELDRVKEAQAQTSADVRGYYLQSSSESLAFEACTFDGVLLNEVLEHVANEERTLSEIHRVLRPGGHLVLMSPNRWFPFEGHGMRLDEWDFNVPFPVPLLPWMPRSIGLRFMSARNYWPRELQQLVKQAGFELVEIGTVFPVFDQYAWIPSSVTPIYRRLLPILETTPIARRFGVSSFIVGRRVS